MNVYLFDIETSPVLGYVWGIYQQDVIEVVEDWYLLSFSAKKLGGRQVTRGLDDFPSYSKNRKNDRKLVEEIWKIFDDADVLIAHNGDSFDIKKCYDRFSYWGMKPPSPFKSIDTLKLAKKHFRFTSNRLDALGEHLGLGRKIETSKSLWLKCMNGDKTSWRQMKKYNAQDVLLLEKVYNKLLPYAENIIYKQMRGKEEAKCDSCGSWDLQRRGFHWKGGRRVQRYQCMACGHWQL